MDEDFEYVGMEDDSILKESFKLDLEKILSLNFNNFFEESDAIIQIIKNYIPNFDSRYKIAGATNLNINNRCYSFPVLTTNHIDILFPNLLVHSDSVRLDYRSVK